MAYNRRNRGLRLALSAGGSAPRHKQALGEKCAAKAGCEVCGSGTGRVRWFAHSNLTTALRGRTREYPYGEGTGVVLVRSAC